MKKITRVKAIRLKCLDCAENMSDILNCKFKECPLYPFRLGKRPKTNNPPFKAIPQYCLWCMNGQQIVGQCNDRTCLLWQYKSN